MSSLAQTKATFYVGVNVVCDVLAYFIALLECSNVDIAGWVHPGLGDS